jgi:hypothetical protein
MAKIHGKNGIVKVASAAVAEVTNWTFTATRETARSDSMGDDAQEHLIGKRAATGSLTCRLDPSDTNGQNALESVGNVALKLYPGADTSGNREYDIPSATITNVSVNADQDDVVSVSFDFQVNGDWTIGAVSGGGG